MLENNEKSNCGFAEEIVSYLYDEMNLSEKSHFEKHLKNCFTCQDELAGFSKARNSIQEWRAEEFLPLENPAIVIPCPQQVKSISRSWLAAVREFFTLSPAWMTASTAFAALAICVVLFALVVSFIRNDQNFAGIEKGSNIIVPSPTNGNQNKNSNVSNANQNTQKTADSPQPPVIADSSKPANRTVEPTKIVAKPNVEKPQNLPVKTLQPKSNGKPISKPQQVKSKKQSAPSFLDEDEEDDSLTLTDLLEQIGTREIDD